MKRYVLALALVLASSFSGVKAQGAKGSGTFAPLNTTHEKNYYLHFNWGWYGDCNGYFLEGIYDTTQAYSYDNPTNVHNYNLNQNVQMIEIYP